MKPINKLVAAVALMSFCVACSSSTVLRSYPSGAKVYLNGEYVGNTPYTMTDSKTSWSSTALRLESPGYAPYVAVISRNEEFQVGACIGGLFLIVPFFWIMGYKPEHTYELRRGGGTYGQNVVILSEISDDNAQ